MPADRKLQNFIYGMAGIEYVKQNADMLKEKFDGREIKEIKIDKVYYYFPFENNKDYDATKRLTNIEFETEVDIDGKLDVEKCLPEKVKNLLVVSISELKQGNIKNFMMNTESYINRENEEYSEVGEDCGYCGYRKICRRCIDKGGIADNE